VLLGIAVRQVDRVPPLVDLHLVADGLLEVDAKGIGKANHMHGDIRELQPNPIQALRTERAALLGGQPLELPEQFARFSRDRHGQVLGRMELVPVSCLGEAAKLLDDSIQHG
jgi:hypothetical protein